LAPYEKEVRQVLAEQRRADGVKEREEWHTFPEFVDEATLVVIDETGANTNMTPLYGWSARGQRLIDYVPHGHWKTTTFWRHCGMMV
jgi:hypothetical protein